MLLRKHRRDTSVVVNMTPMIDVVFLLLIFFMTVSQVSKINSEQVDLPQLRGSEEQKPATIIMNVNKDGEIVVSGTVYTASQLTGLMLDELSNVGNDPNLLKVVIRADRRGNSQAVNEIVTMLKKLDLTRVRIAVQSDG